MAGYTRRRERSILQPREQGAWRRAHALAGGAAIRPEVAHAREQAQPHLGPYEVEYEVQRGYDVQRDIVRP